MRVAFLGSGEFGVPTLAAIAAEHELVGVVSQPDRPAGRGGKLTPTPAAAWVEEQRAGVEIIKPEDVNKPEHLERIRGWKPDAMVVIAFGQKLSEELVAIAPAVNLHASLLPRWRGAAPINWAILGGDTVTGNSVIGIASRMDAGLVYATNRRAIEPTQTAGELHDLLSQDGVPVMLGVLAEIGVGRAKGATQDESRKTRAPKLSREMAVVDFRMSGEECRRKINGLSPWPGVTVKFRGEPLKLLRAGPVGQVGAKGEPGSLADPERGVVACGDGGVELIEVQPAGKRAMLWKDFAAGHRPRVGEKLE